MPDDTDPCASCGHVYDEHDEGQECMVPDCICVYFEPEEQHD